MAHAVERTNAKGVLFLGKCIKCGRENLTVSEVMQPCPADEIVSDEAALLDLIK